MRPPNVPETCIVKVIHFVKIIYNLLHTRFGRNCAGHETMSHSFILFSIFSIRFRLCSVCRLYEISFFLFFRRWCFFNDIWQFLSGNLHEVVYRSTHKEQSFRWCVTKARWYRKRTSEEKYFPLNDDEQMTPLFLSSVDARRFFIAFTIH